MSRFDYVKYDEKAAKAQAVLKNVFEDVESMIDAFLVPGAKKQYALKALEEAYMWCGKDLRDQQILRNGSAPLQEERCDTRGPSYACNCGQDKGMREQHALDCASRRS